MLQQPRFHRPHQCAFRSGSPSRSAYSGALKTLARLIAILFIAGLMTTAAAYSNVALAWLGATTGDNGYFRDAGYAPAPSAHVVDGDWSTHWAGLMHRAPQMVWVNLPGVHEITRVVIGERPDAFVRSGLVEYYDGSRWHPISWIDKHSPGLVLAFPPVRASAVRLTVDSSRAPSSWYNRVAAITALEVYGRPAPGAAARPPSACFQGRLGLDISDALVVRGFVPGSPARYAGVQHGDILESINGVRVRSVAHAQELVAGPPGSMVRLGLWRPAINRTQTYSVFLECLD